MTNKEAAIALASERLIVFPCGPDKKPRGPWKDVEYRSLGQISILWNESDLPAIPVGKHGMLVIDCDVKPNGPDGRVAFTELCKIEGIDLANAFVVTTPSGGLHFYFRTETPYGNSTGSLPPGIDVRGRGGYVIGPGAVLPDGRTYRHDHGSWDAIPALPEALAKYLTAKGVEVSPASPEPVSALPIATEGDKSWARGALADACAIIRGASEGSRNQTLNNQALAIGEIAANCTDDEWSAIGGALLQAAIESGLGEDESRKTIASGFSKGVKQRRELPSEKQVDVPEGGLFRATVTNSEPEAPRPLRRENLSGTPFPIEALGNALGRTARAIADKIQCPEGMAALSVLGAASLAVQAHANVKLPASEQVKPLSLFLVSIGESGERKSAADNEALRAVRMYEQELSALYGSAIMSHRDAHDAWEAARTRILKGKSESTSATVSALATLGPEPVSPLTPMLTCSEPTYEGLCNLYQSGYPSLGLFSDEGGQFVGGHGMSDDTRLRTITGLSSLWDGSPIKRVRATKEGTFILPGRRLALHLMMQPGVSASLLSDPTLKDQGFLSRLLVSYPPSMTGTRFQRPNQSDTRETLDKYTAHLLTILRHRPRMIAGKLNELEPSEMNLDDQALLLWNDYADSIERNLGSNGKYESIKRFASKLPEHATCIAGVLTLFENLSCPSVSHDALSRGIAIANHFADEALRLFDASGTALEIGQAERLLDWLQSKWTDEHVGLVAVYQYGPNGIRDARTAKAVMSILIEHGWLVKAPAGTLVNGKPVKEAWRIVRPPNSEIAN